MADDEKKSSRHGVIKEPSVMRKFLNIMFTDDPETSAKNFMKHVVEPSIRRGIVDMVATIVLGHPVCGGNPFATFTNWNNPSSNGNVPYWQFGSGGSMNPPSNAMVANPTANGARFNGTVFFKTYQDARDTLEQMNIYLAEYKRVSMLELYEYAGIEGNEYAGNNWGWTDLSGSRIYESSGGWILHLPPVKVIQ